MKLRQRTCVLIISLLLPGSEILAQDASILLRLAENSYPEFQDSTELYSRKILQTDADSKIKAKANFLIGTVHFNSGNYDSTKYYLNQFLTIDSLKTNYEMYPRVFSWLCHIEMQEDNWRAAMDHALLGKELADQLQDTIRMIDHRQYLGEIYRNFNPNNLDKPLEYQLEALKLSKAYGHPLLITYSYNFMGSLYYEMDSLEKARNYYLSTIEVAETIGDDFAIAQAYHNLGDIAKKENDLESAISNNKKATKYCRKNADQMSYDDILAYCFAEIAEIYFDQGEYRMANLYADSAYQKVDVASAYKAKIMLIKSKLEAVNGNYKVAYELAQQYTVLNDSLNSLNNSKHINNLMSWYEHEKDQKEIAELENTNNQIALNLSLLELENSKSKHEKSMLIWLLICLGIVAGGWVLWLIQKRKTNAAQLRLNQIQLTRKAQEMDLLKQQLKTKTQSLSSYALMLSQKNEMLDDLKSKLNLMNHQETQDMINKIKLSQSFENEWLEFNHLFAQVHPQFVENLAERCSDLTPNDKRICVLLKMQMSSKQIAQVIGVEPRTVDMARSRIRKKLGLQKVDNLNDYIDSI